MSHVLVIIAKRGFQDHELEGTRSALVAAGHQVTLASTEEGTCTGKFGGNEEATIDLKTADPSAFDATVFIGGPGASALRDHPDAIDLAKRAAATGKILGAICIAPTILASAGVLKGKQATVWNEDGEQQKYIEDRDAVYTGDDVTVDGVLVTGNGPEAAAAFGEMIVKILNENRS